jgi:hypothetical protein
LGIQVRILTGTSVSMVRHEATSVALTVTMYDPELAPGGIVTKNSIKAYE